MALTPQEVEKQTFSTALRGYDLNEVDDFLDQVVVTLVEMQTALDAAGGAPAGSGEAGAPSAVTPATVVADESALGRVLLTAQQTADQILADARAEADRILAEAQSDADEMVTKRDEHRARAEAEMADLTTRVSDVRNKLAVLATAVADRLDEMDDTIASTLAGGDGAELTTPPDVVEDGDGDDGNVYAIGSASADDEGSDETDEGSDSSDEESDEDRAGDGDDDGGDEEEDDDDEGADRPF
jgi:cell division initiation protein